MCSEEEWLVSLHGATVAEQPQRRDLVGDRPGEEVGERSDLTGSRGVLGGCLGHAVPLPKREAWEVFSRGRSNQASIDGEPQWKSRGAWQFLWTNKISPGLEKGIRLDQD